MRESDAAALFAYRSDPEVARYQGFAPKTPADAEAFLVSARAARFDEAGAWCQLAVRRADSGELIGDIGTRPRRDDGSQVEIGVTIAPEHQRQGYAKDALAALLDHLFGNLGKRRVFASVDPRNRASIALLEGLGFRQEAHFRESLRFKGEWVDDMVFAILAREWTRRPRRNG
jgi:RimJ/RimL family protein N-acetyltransferase